ncbi:MAG TPA: alpha/beta fold hydrolase [Kofleriaceae bacterium]|jgi:pimeloyl-ACP methyl ester carboxylesterase
MLARFAALLVLIAPTFARAEPFTQDAARKIVSEQQKVVSPDGIDQQLEITIGGTKQWITVRGRDLKNPILLFIHGGPAAPEMPTSWTFQNPWEDFFTVVQWDQRGSGKTYNANDPKLIAPTLSTERMAKDAEEVVQYLRAQYHKDKIFVLGHSWGSNLGLLLAERHPEWLYAYIGMGQMIDTRASEQESYASMLAIAQARHDADAIKELKAIAPYPEPNGSLVLDKVNVERKWVMKLGGLTYDRDNYAYYYNASELSPDYTDADLDAIGKGSQMSLTALLGDFGAVNFEKVTDFRCPIIIFNGRHDETVSSKVTAAWFARVHAPVKRLVWFEHSAHMMQIEEPGRVLLHLVEDVRPLAGAQFATRQSSI